MSKANISPEPWERQKGESTKAFEAFVTYRDMERRSIRKVAAELGKSATLMTRWSSKYNWVERAAAWDDELERIARDDQIKEIKKMRKRHADLGKSMLVLAAKAMKEMKPKEVKPADVSRMVEVGSKLERISRGDVGEVIEERDGGESTPIVQFYIPDNGRDQESSEETEE